MTTWQDRLNDAAEFDEDPLTPLKRLTDAALTTSELRNLPIPDALIDGHLLLDSTAMLYGPPGSGKSFLALDMGLHVSTGSWWHGHRVTPGPVVYLAAEGVNRMSQRVDAWCKHHGIYDLDRHHPIHWLPLPVPIHQPEWSSALAEFAAERQAKLVIIDTLARCALGADENSARDMGMFIEGMDRVRRATGACVKIVHHSGKDLTAGARGNSALKGAMDTELELTGTEDRCTLKMPKQKDGRELGPMHFRRIEVGESCVLIPAKAFDPSDGVSVGALATLDTLRQIQVAGGVSAAAWRVAATAGERAFYVHRKQLLDAGLVENIGTDKTPRYQAKHDEV